MPGKVVSERRDRDALRGEAQMTVDPLDPELHLEEGLILNIISGNAHAAHVQANNVEKALKIRAKPIKEF